MNFLTTFSRRSKMLLLPVFLIMVALILAAPFIVKLPATAFSQQPGAPVNAASDPSHGDAAASTKKKRSAPTRPRNEDVDKWGEITIAQPKIWQYERVNALLDGLLRDVEGVSLSDLVQLNPNSQNAAAVRFVQSALGVAVQFDQAAQVNNSNILQNFKVQHDGQVEQLNLYNAYVQSLATERNRLANEIIAANNTVTTLQPLKTAGTITSDQDRQLADANNRVATLPTQLTNINSQISGAGAAPTLTAPPTVTGTSAASLLPAAPTPSSFADLLKALPDSVQKGLGNALQSPSYPATKQLDNFITLLHERLAREISVLQDDLVRDPKNLAYLVQFDVGLYPSDKTKDHMARVEFDLEGCTGCKVYSLYPGQSSYNVVNYQGSSKRRSFAGNVMTLFGLGISANYQRQEDTLKGSLVQSVYIAGFQDDTEGAEDTTLPEQERINQRFGWYYNAAPFDQYVAPGIRSTFAIITVPRERVEQFKAEQAEKFKAKNDANAPFRVNLKVNAGWARRDNPLYQKDHWFSTKTYLDAEHSSMVSKNAKLTLPGTESLIELPTAVIDDKQRLHVMRMEYEKVKFAKSEAAPAATPGRTPAANAAPAAPLTTRSAYTTMNGCNKGECATVLLTLDVPIDPNLVITANGMPLHRVRDWRGRATSVLPPVQSLSDIGAQPSGNSAPKSESVASRSLLETDQLEPNSWFAVTSHDLLLNISRAVAGESLFPVIQIADPAKRTLVIPNDIRQNFTEIITSGYRFLPVNEDRVPKYIQRNFGGNAAQAAPSTYAQNDSLSARTNAPGAGGPYPYSTFLPLFMPEPPPQRFYAFVGQTGDDLIIGFLRPSPEEANQSEHHRYRFLETRSMVVLEDPDIDLAWSLRCYIQGEELVCKMPMDAIRRSYLEVACTCGEDSCPSIQAQIQPILRSIRKDDTVCKAGYEKRAAEALNLGMAFVPSLQVWVEQFDPEDKNAFYSPEPAKVGLFPLSKDFTQEQGRPFEPWHFYGDATTEDEVAIEECNYFTKEVEVPGPNDSAKCTQETTRNSGPNGTACIRFLNPAELPVEDSSQNLLLQERPNGNARQGSPPQSNACRYVTVNTFTLQRPEVVLEMRIREKPADAGQTTQPDLRWTAAIPAAQLRPEFGTPKVTPTISLRPNPGTGFGTAEWTIRIPVSRLLCTDEIEEAGTLHTLGVTVNWMDGDEVRIRPRSTDGRCPAEWWAADRTRRHALEFKISKSVASQLPPALHLVRNSRNGKITIVTLPNLRRLILPYRLKAEPIGDNQFALRGPNAGAIDAVAVQNGTTARTYQAGSGVDLAVVDVTPPPKPDDATKNAGGNPTSPKAKKPPVTTNPITSGPSGGNPGSPSTANGKGTPPPPQSNSGSAQPPPAKGATSGAASVAGGATPASPTPVMATGQQSAKPTPKNLSGTSNTQSNNKGLLPSTYALLPLIYDEKNKRYVPIDVTDDQGKPLTYTKPAAKDPTTGGTKNEPDETVTITKTTKKPTPAVAPGAMTPK